jgi:hypothetical protein
MRSNVRIAKVSLAPVLKSVGVGVCALLIAGTLIWTMVTLLQYRTSEYRGDGVITDRGFWSYPRYRLWMPELLLTETAQHSYSLDGLPTEDFTFGLRIVNVTVEGQNVLPEDFEAVRNDLSVSIEVRITDEQGETVAYAPSSPVQEWISSASVLRTYLWHDELRDVRLRRGREYRLDVDIHTEAVNGTRVVGEAFLEGGGNELP